MKRFLVSIFILAFTITAVNASRYMPILRADTVTGPYENGEYSLEEAKEDGSQAGLPAWGDEFRPQAVSTELLPSGMLDMEEAVNIALTRAPEIQTAVSDLEQVRAQKGIVLSEALPQVDLNSNAQRLETFKSTSALGLDELNFGTTLSITQSLLSFGRFSSILNSASADEAAAIAVLAGAKSDVRFGVESSFLWLVLAKEQNNVTHERLEVAEELLRRAKVREMEGAGTIFDVTRAEAEHASARAKLAESKYAVDSASEALSAAMGLPAGTAMDIKSDLKTDMTPVLPENAEEIALSERPDLVILSHRIRSSKAMTEYERAQGRPLIDVFASASYTRHKYISKSSFFSGEDASSAIGGIGVTMPIFDGFLVRESVRKQRAATESLEARYKRARLDAARDIRSIYFDMGASRESFAARRDGVAAAREALRMANVSFDAGRATSLDVIQASLTLSDARRAEAEAAYSYRLGLSRLVRATGTDEVLQGGIK